MSTTQEPRITFPPDCRQCQIIGILVNYTNGDRTLVCPSCGADLRSLVVGEPFGPLVSVEDAEKARQARQAALGAVRSSV